MRQIDEAFDDSDESDDDEDEDDEEEEEKEEQKYPTEMIKQQNYPYIQHN